MIKSFKDIAHKGLRELVEKGKTSKIQANQVRKIENILAIMINSSSLEAFKSFPGYSLHQLKGDLQGFWSVTVTGNYRIIFKFEKGYFFIIDYVDYH